MPLVSSNLSFSLSTESSNFTVGAAASTYTVSELTAVLRRKVEDAFASIRVRGEVSQCKLHASGHLYLRLKDEHAVIEAVCWRTASKRLSIRPQDGMEVICTGRLTTYSARSQYQLVIETVVLAGQGAILKLLEERKLRLAEEGLFNPERKRKLPFLPEVIGIITSPTGAVIQDILHRLTNRFPRRVLLWPVSVQGAIAAEQIACAIFGFNSLPSNDIPRPDLLIVARGGGSLEDLMPFNEEIVVRAAAASVIPLISAVGHETDTTLIDHVADLRAPTPTAAAELAVPVRASLLNDLLSRGQRQVSTVNRLLSERLIYLQTLGRGLVDPIRLLEAIWQRLDDKAERLTPALSLFLEHYHAQLMTLTASLRSPKTKFIEAHRCLDCLRQRLDYAANYVITKSDYKLKMVVQYPNMGMALQRLLVERQVCLAGLSQILNSLSYESILHRGFTLVLDTNSKLIKSTHGIVPGQQIVVRFADGIVMATVNCGPLTAVKSVKFEKSNRSRNNEDQGRLF
jgi:exodeoxyribonuclease VII large subunit